MYEKIAAAREWREKWTVTNMKRIHLLNAPSCRHFENSLIRWKYLQIIAPP